MSTTSKYQRKPHSVACLIKDQLWTAVSEITTAADTDMAQSGTALLKATPSSNPQEISAQPIEREPAPAATFFPFQQPPEHSAENPSPAPASEPATASTGPLPTPTADLDTQDTQAETTQNQTDTQPPLFAPAVLSEVLLNESPETIIQAAYIAYYGRPADPGGLAAWTAQLEAAGGDLSNIIGAFGNSDEFLQRYGHLSNRELVNEIYRQSFGRDADPEGLDGYTALLDSGERTLQSIALDILFGARNSDADTILQKIAFADQFTQAVTDGEFIYDGTAHANAAKQVLLEIDYQTDNSDFSQHLQDYTDSTDTRDHLNNTVFSDVGDSLESAVEVSLDAQAQASASGFADDADFFRISAPSNGEATFSLTQLTDNLDLYLYNAAGAELARATSAASSNESITHQLEKGLDYFVAVKPQGSASSRYQLDFDLTLETGGNDQLQGQEIPEAGDQQALAVAVEFDELGQASATGYNGYLADTADYYAFTALADGQAHFALEQLTANLDLSLYAADGSVLATSANNSNSNEAISFELVEGAGYAISVHASGSAASAYQLSFDLAVNTGGNDLVNSLDITDAGNTLAEAAAIELDVFGDASASGYVGFVLDGIDYYRFSAPTSGQATIDLSNLQQDINLTLLDEAGFLLAQSQNAAANNESLTVNVDAGKTYILRLAPQGTAESAYHLDLNLPVDLGGQDIVAGSNVDDAGNTQATAQLVPLDTQGDALIVGSAGFVDDSGDFFQFQAPASGNAVFALGQLQQNLNLALYRSDGTLISQSNSDGIADEQITFTVSQGQNYLLHVQPQSSAESSYQLSLDLSVNTGGNDSVDGVDIGEAGDQRNTAQPVSANALGEISINGFSGFVDDSGDFFSFIAPSSGIANIALSGLAQDLNLKLYDNQGTLLQQASLTGSQDETLQQHLLAGQTYFAEVSPLDSAESAYSLMINLAVEQGGNDTVSGTAIGDAGNTLALAEQVSLDAFGMAEISGYNGYVLDDADYYRFDAPTSGLAELNLSGLSDNLNLTLFDALGNPLSASNQSANSDESLQYALSGNQSYYARVAADGDAQSAYTLNLNLAVESGGNDQINGDDIGDAGDLLAAANLVGTNEQGQASIVGFNGYLTDSDDYYRFVAPADGLSSLQLNGLSDNLDLILYDAQGNQLSASSQSGSNAESIQYHLTEGQSYAARVSASQNAQSSYALTLNLAVETGGNDVVTGTDIGDAGSSIADAASLTVDELGEAQVTGFNGFVFDSSDFYHFVAPADGQANIRLNGLADDLNLALYNSQENLLAASNQSGNQDDVVTYNLVKGQHYYLGITAVGVAQSAYALNLDLPVETGGSDQVNAIDIGDAGDTLAAATVITIGETGEATASGYNGFVSDNNDYYSFVAQASGQATVTLDGLAEDLNLSLYDAQGNLLLEAAHAGISAETLQLAVTQGQTYFVRISPEGTAQSVYTLSLNLPIDLGGNDTVNGTDIGDASNQRSEASAVSLDEQGDANVIGYAGFASDDGDFFSITAPASGLTSITLSELSQNLDLLLYDHQGSLLTQSSQTDAQSETILFSLSENQTYFVQVSALGNAQSSYTLNLDLPVYLGGNDLVGGADIGDAGNSLPSARLITLDELGDAQVSGYAGFDNDSADYFRFVAPASGTASLNLSGLKQDLDLVLLDNQGNQLNAPNQQGTLDESIQHNLIEGQSYYLQVSPNDAERSSYNLSLDLAVEMGGNDVLGTTDIGDAGNDRPSATTVTPDLYGDASVTGYSGFTTDSGDYYHFVAAATGSARIDLSGLDQDLNLFFYDGQGNFLQSSAQSHASSESIQVNLTEDQSYYVYVAPLGTQQSAYTLSFDLPIDLGGNDLINGIDVGDAGDDLGNAASVAISEFGDASVNGYSGFVTDEGDFYRFISAESGTANFNLSGLEENLNLFLYDYQGNLIAFSTQSGTSAESIQYTLSEGQTYYARVLPLDTEESAYALTFDLPVDLGGSDVVNGIVIGDSGNQLAQAATLSIDNQGLATVTGYNGYQSDTEDYFHFVAPGTGSSTITLSGLNEDLNLFLYDSQGNFLKHSSQDGNVSESVQFDLLEDQSYYLRITPDSNADKSPYTLSLDLAINLGGNDVVGGVDIGDAGDTQNTAQLIEADIFGNATASGYAGFVADGGDYYRFVASTSGTASLGLSDLQENLNLFLYDHQGSLLTFSTQSGNNAENIQYTVTEGLSYYARILPLGNDESAYTFSLSLPVELGGNDIVNNIDIGDAGSNQATANSISIDESGNASVNGYNGFVADNSDYYRFVAPASGQASLNLSGLNEDLNLFLYNSQGGLLGASSQNGSTSESIQYNLSDNQTYYLQVQAVGTAQSAYALSLDLMVNPGGNDRVNGVDIGDAGGTLGSAQLISTDNLGDASVSGYAGFISDSADSYRFVAPASGLSTFSLSGLDENLDLYLYNSLGNLLSAASQSGSSDTIQYNLSDAQTYYLQVLPDGSAESAYTLSLDLAVNLGGNDRVNGVDIGDAANTLAGAQQINIDASGTGSVTGYNGFVNDEGDYYRFVAPASGSSSVTLNGLSENLDLQLYNHQGVLLSASSQTSSNIEAINYSLSEGLTYYVRVLPVENAESAYSLSLNLAVNQGGDDRLNGVNIGDAGDTQNAAQQVTLDAQGDAVASGYAGFASDEGDYYRVIAPGSGLSSFSLSGLDQDLNLFLYNGSGNFLGSSALSGTNNDTLQFSLTQGASYYVRVAPLVSSESAYTLNFDLPIDQGGNDIVAGVDIGDASGQRSSAKSVTLDANGQALISGHVGYLTDYDDYFSFVAPGSGIANFNLSGLSDNIDLYLYTSSGSLAAFSSNTGNSNDSITFSLTAGNTYTLRTTAISDAQSSYQLALDLPVNNGSSGSGQLLNDTGDSANRVDFIILGDGYAAADESLFYQHASNFTDYLLNSPLADPFVTYRDLINVNAIFTESAQSGVDDPSTGTQVNTVFDASFGQGGVQRLMYGNESKVTAYLSSNGLTGSNAELVLVLTNSSQYGGAGGTYAWASGGNSSSFEVALHELGHSFANLGDEYVDSAVASSFSDSYFNVANYGNISNNPNTGPWDHWLGITDVTGSVIDFYEGAYYRSTGYYRATETSKMLALNAKFNLPQQEAFVSNFYDSIALVDAINLGSGNYDNLLRLQAETAATAVAAFEWRIDGQLIYGGSQDVTALSLADHISSSGNYQITLTVVDDTGKLKLFPSNATQNYTWTTNITGVFGTQQNDGSINGSAASEFIAAKGGNDWIVSGGGNDHVSGGSGLDYLQLGANLSSYTLGSEAYGIRPLTGAGQSLQLESVERIVFSDTALALDIDGTAGDLYRLYAVAFDQAPDAAAMGHWLSEFENGMSILDIAEYFTDTSMPSLYGALTNEGFLDVVYNSIYNRAPTQNEYDQWLPQLQSGSQSREQVLVSFADSADNQTLHSAMVAQGIEFDYWG